MLAARASSLVLMRKDEWADIVQYMYAPADAATLSMSIKEAARVGSRKGSAARQGDSCSASGKPERDSAPPLALSFHSFMQVLLNFQLDGHLLFLRPFVSSFRALDEQHSGLLSADGFRELAFAVAPHLSPDEVAQLVSAVDPQKHQRITFSDCVATLSKELVARMGDH